MKRLYLIKRGPRPAYHRAPFHPVILCTHKCVADKEVGGTDDGDWLWTKFGWGRNGAGWLLERWNGFPIDYGGVVRGFALPDGTHAAFWRDYDPWPKGIQNLLPGAVWWTDQPMPAWLQERGVIYPPDRFSRQVILDTIADDGCQGFSHIREYPSLWPEPTGD